MDWRIGCSGFGYNEWDEFFYPAGLLPEDRLAYYARFFDTLELNVSFYRFPGKIFLRNLAAKVPPHFRFVIKAPRSITHIKQMNGVQEDLALFYKNVREGLGNYLGTVLFQFPPAFSYSDERLELLIYQLDNSVNNVIEFRHGSWWNTYVYDTLAKHRICFCSVSHPAMPNEVIVNTSFVYYRFHGVPKRYYSIYEEAFLQNITDAIRLHPDVEHSYMVFNNTATRAAIENAAFLQDYLCF